MTSTLKGHDKRRAGQAFTLAVIMMWAAVYADMFATSVYHVGFVRAMAIAISMLCVAGGVYHLARNDLLGTRSEDTQRMILYGSCIAVAGFLFRFVSNNPNLHLTADLYFAYRAVLVGFSIGFALPFLQHGVHRFRNRKRSMQPDLKRSAA